MSTDKRPPVVKLAELLERSSGLIVVRVEDAKWFTTKVLVD